MLEYRTQVQAKPDKKCVTFCAVDRWKAVRKSGKSNLRVERRPKGRTEEVKWGVGVLFPSYSRMENNYLCFFEIPRKKYTDIASQIRREN